MLIYRALLALTLLPAFVLAADPPPVTSAFYPPAVRDRIRARVATDRWAKDLAQRAVAAADPWMKMSDDQAWSLMFPANLPRSWMVWSNGHCPSCTKPVPMYDWQIDAIARPWKLRCPHCQQLFPTNDFKAFYNSGLDPTTGLFDPKRADRSLLFNAAHPDKSDPLHTFGVDDGAGFSDGTHRWRFIPAYLIYGQWKQAVLGGIKRLATAYVLTGDDAYARKAGILLHRVADLYPTFDFKSQGVVYEVPSGDGYVSIWHDACIETRELAISFDAVKEVIARDELLARFLSRKLPPPAKGDLPILLFPANVLDHIHDGILHDPIRNAHRIYSNYPQQALTLATIHTALNWPANRAQVLAMLKPVLDKSIAVDGVTGEKGLAGYSAYAAQQLALFLGYYTRVDPQFLPDLVKQTPRLPQMWRFFIDTRCLDRYYPLSGDTLYFAASAPTYVGTLFSTDHFLGTTTGHSTAVLPPSMYSFLHDLHKLTGDPAFAHTLYLSNDSKLDGLPHDLFSPDPDALRHDVEKVISEHGPHPSLASVHKPEWHLAILRSGSGPTARALWLDYDTWGGHGHADGMNLGLFALGLDLAPDFGYPPVQFGGWESPRANWYKSTAAHNTVLVDSANQPNAAGSCTLFAPGAGFSAVSASAPAMVPNGKTYARTLALIDTSPDHSYALDIFRVAGGKDHLRGFSSHFSTLTTTLGSLAPADDLRHDQFRDVRVARAPKPGWSADFKITDRYNLLPSDKPRNLHLRHHDFTTGADAYTADAWVIAGLFNSTDEAWIPRLLTRRKADGTSTFVSLLEPYDTTPLIRSAQRLPLLLTKDNTPAPDTAACLSVTLLDGQRDLLLSTDSPAAPVTQPDEKLTASATLAHLRLDPAGRPVSLTLCQSTRLSTPALTLELSKPIDLLQLSFTPAGFRVLTGDASVIASLTIDGQPLPPAP